MFKTSFWQVKTIKKSADLIWTKVISANQNPDGTDLSGKLYGAQEFNAMFIFSVTQLIHYNDVLVGTADCRGFILDRRFESWLLLPSPGEWLLLYSETF
jgi:hypothetical protein